MATKVTYHYGWASSFWFFAYRVGIKKIQESLKSPIYFLSIWEEEELKEKKIEYDMAFLIVAITKIPAPRDYERAKIIVDKYLSGGTVA